MAIRVWTAVTSTPNTASWDYLFICFLVWACTICPGDQTPITARSAPPFRQKKNAVTLMGNNNIPDLGTRVGYICIFYYMTAYNGYLELVIWRFVLKILTDSSHLCSCTSLVGVYEHTITTKVHWRWMSESVRVCVIGLYLDSDP